MSKNALIVIDIQNFFITDDLKDLPLKIADFIELSKNEYDFLLFTRFVNNPKSNFYKALNWKECEHSPSIDIPPVLESYASSENTFDKSTFSIFKSDITQYLYDNNVTKVDLCGVDFDACVISSAFEGFDLGFEVKVISELCLSSGGDDITKAMKKIVDRNLCVQSYAS